MFRSGFLFSSMFMCFLSFGAQAGEQNGKISQIVVRSDNLHYFFLEGTPTNKPACAKSGYWMIKDENSVAGRSLVSLLLSAQAQQKSIRVVGSGTCTRWFDGEDVFAIINPFPI